MSLTDKRVYNAAIAFGFERECANLVVAQARHETGNYTSKVYIQNKNCFGMRPAHKRTTTRIQTEKETDYAVYETIENSVHDLAYWFSYNGLPKDYRTVEDYAEAIRSKGYFEASLNEYENGMNAALKKLQA
jgi:uncharacterized FlgJ-related protein